MRVDHYTATVAAEGPEALAWLFEAVPIREQALLGRDGAVSRYMYHHAVAVLDGKTTVGVVRWGGNGEGSSIELKGSVANETYGLLRAKWPEHSVSRMDTCIDATAPGLFDDSFRSFEILRAQAPINRRPKLDQRGDWTDVLPRRDGRTAYYGSRDSGVVVCMYEKGWEREARAGLVDQDKDWTRLELRLTPARKEQKALLSGVQPSNAWGWSQWSASFLDAFTGIKSERVQLPDRISDDDKTYGALLAQYGGFLDRQAGGDWAAIGERIGRDLAAMSRLKPRKRA